MREHAVVTGNGRVLKVLEDGDPAGRPVLVHNGMPNSRLLFAEDPPAARAKCERERVEMLTQTLPELMKFLETLLAPVDAAALTGELGQYLIDATHSGMGTSSDGWWDDGVAMLEPWGFDLGAIKTPHPSPARPSRSLCPLRPRGVAGSGHPRGTSQTH